MESHDYDFDNNSYDNDSSSCDSFSHNKISNIISYDNDRHVIKRIINNRKVKITVYTTKYTPGSVIRNAVTGFYQSGFYVGKSDEKQFFKISLSGDLGQNPVSKHLYYDSPEQYEQHFQTTIDSVIKNNWKAKFSNVNDIVEKNDEAEEEYTIIH